MDQSKCEIEFSNVQQHVQSSSKKRKSEATAEILYSQGKYSNLQLNLMFINSKCTRIIIGEKEFNVHEEILKVSSSYFATSLSGTWDHNKRRKSDIGEKAIINLDVEDIEAFETMLRLLYFNNVANELENVSKALRVLKLCHEFLFEDLEEKCIEFIRKTMKLEDMSDISEVASTWEIDGLKKQIQTTLQTNDYNMLPPDNLIKVIESGALGNVSARSIARMEMQCNKNLNSSVNKQVIRSIFKDHLLFASSIWNPRHYRGIEEFLWEIIKDFMPHDDVVKHMCLNPQLMEALKAARLDASRTLSSILCDSFNFLAEGVVNGTLRPEMLLAFSKWNVFVFQKSVDAVKKIVAGMVASLKVGKTSSEMFVKVVQVLMKIMRPSDLKEHDDALVKLLQNVDPSLGIQVCKIIMQVESNEGMVKLGESTTKEIMNFQQSLMQAKIDSKKIFIPPSQSTNQIGESV